MTLLFGYAADDFVVLASDRMITWDVGSEERRYAQQTNKTSFVAGQILVAFSGTADIAGNTEDWLARTFGAAARSETRGLNMKQFLVAELTRDLSRLRRRNRSAIGLWVSLLLVGYDSSKRGFLTVITNDAAGGMNFGKNTLKNFRDFSGAAPSVPIRGNAFRFWAVGSCPPELALIEAGEAIRRYRRRYPGHCSEIARTMARVVVARSRQDPGVGSTVQVTVMPASAAGQQWVDMSFVGFQDPIESTTYVCFNPDVLPSGTPVVDGISVITDEMVMQSPRFVVGHDDVPPRPPFEIPPPGA